MEEKKYFLSLENRRILNITDVDEVLSFDDCIINLSVNKSPLTVTGIDLTITDLSVKNGNLTIIGNINSIIYSDDTPKKSFWQRLFS